MKLKTSYKVGETVRIGDVDYIIAHEDKYITYLICKYCDPTENTQFNPSAGQTTYEGSTIHEKCKTWYQEKIPNEVKDFLITPECGYGCPVFIPTLEQVADPTDMDLYYFYHGQGEWSYFKDDDSRVFRDKYGKAQVWYLQSQWPISHSGVSGVCCVFMGEGLVDDGGISCNYPDFAIGFRPCLAIHTVYLEVIGIMQFKKELMREISVNNITEGMVWKIGDYLYDVIETTPARTILVASVGIPEIVETINKRCNNLIDPHKTMSVPQFRRAFLTSGLFVDYCDIDVMEPVIITYDDQGNFDTSTFNIKNRIRADGLVWCNSNPEDPNAAPITKKARLGAFVDTRLLLAKDLESGVLPLDERFHFVSSREYLES